MSDSEQIFNNIINNERITFLTFDEILNSWKVTDSVKSTKLPLRKYKKGTLGPHEAKKIFES